MLKSFGGQITSGRLKPLGSWILINVSIDLPIGERALINARIKGQLKRTVDRAAVGRLQTDGGLYCTGSKARITPLGIEGAGSVWEMRVDLISIAVLSKNSSSSGMLISKMARPRQPLRGSWSVSSKGKKDTSMDRSFNHSRFRLTRRPRAFGWR